MSVTEVCRLCPDTANLVYIFDEKLALDRIRDVIHITTGILITEKDEVSQKVCSRCCNITLKMFNFRQGALKHDKELKERLKHLRKQINTSATNVAPASENQKPEGRTDVWAKEKVKRKFKEIATLASPPSIEKDNKRTSEDQPPIHHTVAELYRTYPNLRLPTLCLPVNISPFVSLRMGEVEEYCKKRKININSFRYPRIIIKPLKPPPIQDDSAIVTDTRELPSNDSGGTLVEVNNAVVAAPEELTKRKSNDNLENVEVAKKKKVDTDKPNFINSLGLAPKATGSSDPPMSLDKTSTLHICNLCNSVQYNARDLKKHQQSHHLVCPFCRGKFRTMEKKTQHIENDCLIKNAMLNQPHVELQKVEYNLTARMKYQYAFAEFPPHPALENVREDKQTQPEEPSGDHQEEVSVVEFDKPEVIEILSDDEDVENEVSNDADDVEIEPEQNEIHQENVAEENYPPRVNQPISPTADSGVDLNSPAKNSDTNNAPFSAVIRPQIRIKNNNFLTGIDPKTPEVKVIKDLIGLVRAPTGSAQERKVSNSTQTDLPRNKDIKLNRFEYTCELQNLKSQLTMYKIPLVIKNGQFNVCYRYGEEPKKATNKHYWKDLPVIDVKKQVGVGDGKACAALAPLTVAPAPRTAISTSATIVTAPATVVTAPATIVTASGTIVTGSGTIVTAPATIVTSPATIVTAPTTIVTPVTTFAAPVTNFAAPVKNFTAPAALLTAPTTALATPAMNLTAPTKMLPAPTTTLATPAMNFTAPTKMLPAPTTLATPAMDLTAQTKMLPAPTTMLPARTTMLPAPATAMTTPATMLPARTTMLPAPATAMTASATMLTAPTMMLTAPATMLTAPATVLAAQGTMLASPRTTQMTSATIGVTPRPVPSLRNIAPKPNVLNSYAASLMSKSMDTGGNGSVLNSAAENMQSTSIRVKDMWELQ